MKNIRLLFGFLVLTGLFVWHSPVYAADIIGTSEYLDTNDNGTVDTIRWTMDENVTACAYEVEDWTVNTAGDFHVTITGLTCTGVDHILDVNITADADVTGSTDDPVISYDNDDTDNSVTLTSGNMANHASVTVTDSAKPVLDSVELSSAGSRNRIYFYYTENITLAGGDGASTVTKGNLAAAGTVAGFGSFAVANDVSVPTTLNTVGGDGTSIIYIDLADQPGGYMNGTSTTEPSGAFTPVASDQVEDAAGLKVNIVAAAPVAIGGGSWDLVKPTITSVTVSDAAGSNGRIDRAVVVFNSPMRDSNISDADADLGSVGTTTGVFTSGAPNDPTTTFNRTDNNSQNTSVAAGDFTYDGSTTYITDLAGNLLNTLADGTIASGDIGEIDGASPVILSARYLDNNPADGAVDRVEFTTSTDVGITCTAFTGGVDLTVGTPGEVGLTMAVGDACASNGTSTVTITLDNPGTALTTGGLTSPVVTYGQPGNGIEDGAGNDMLTAASITVADGAAPIVQSARYLDNNPTDGAVDRVEFTTTADTGIACTAFNDETDFTVGTAGDIGLTESAGDTCASNGTSTVTITLATPGTALTTSGSTDPIVSYTQPGNGVEDNAGNDMPTAAGVTVDDGAAPVYISSATLDNNGNGIVDYIKIVYSEDIDDGTVALGDFRAGIVDTSAGNLTELFSSGTPGAGIETDVTDDNTIYVGVTDGTETILPDTTDYALKIQQVGAVSDQFSNALASFASQDSTDGAGPVIISGAYSDSNSDGTVDRIVLIYTENATFTMDGVNWNFSTPSNMTFGGDFLVGDCTGTGTTTITCADADNSDFTADANETGVSVGAQPDWTFGTSTNVTDGSVKAPSQTVTLEDSAAPVVIDATLDYNDNVSELVANFTEEVTALTSDETKFHINNVTGVDDVTLSTATTSGDGASLTFPLTETQRVAALLISGVTGGDAGTVVLDVDAGAVADTTSANTNLIDDNNTVTETADTHAPALSQWDLNYNTNTLTLTFSETVDASTLAATAITIQDAATATTSYTLTGGTTASADGTAIVVDLTVTDVNAIKAMSGLAETTANAFLRTTTLLIDDIGTNSNTAIPNGSALQANSVTGSGSFGDLGGSLLLSTNVLNQPAKAGIYFQVQNNLPVDGKIEIIFPAVFNIAGALSLEDLSNIDGTFNVVPSGQTVTITRLGDGAVVTTGTDVSFKLVRVVNPSSLGITPTFTFRTKNAVDTTLDEDTAVSGQIIILPTAPLPSEEEAVVTSGGGGGGGFRTPAPFLVQSKTEAITTTSETGPAASSEHAAAPTEPSAFDDVTGHWAESYISKIADLGVVTGKTPIEFAPDDNISRAELLKIAVNAFGFTVPDAVTEKPLPDVEIGDWYAPYVKSALDNNLIYDFTDGLDPNTPASRGMSATVLAKAAKFTDVNQNFADNYSSHSDWNFAHFPDVPMNAYFTPFVAYLTDKGVINGYEDGTFGPGNPITRAEIAKIVVKLLEILTPTESTEPASSETAGTDNEMMEGQGLTETPAETPAP